MELCRFVSAKLVVHNTGVFLFMGEMSAPQVESEISVFMLLYKASTFRLSPEAQDSHRAKSNTQVPPAGD